MSAVVCVQSYKWEFLTAAIFRETDRTANITKLFHTYVFVVLYDCVYVYVGRELYNLRKTEINTKTYALMENYKSTKRVVLNVNKIKSYYFPGVGIIFSSLNIHLNCRHAQQNGNRY
jgi:hypothetical protein